MSIQREIYDAVVRRGYRKGWTADQFAARQVAKLTEEFGELIDYVHLDHGDTLDHSTLSWAVMIAAAEGRRVFDDVSQERWAHSSITSPQAAMDELADIVVVACCLAEALGEIRPDLDTDLMRAALAKASADVVRGVRAE